MAVACVDLKKAYNKVCREKLWCVLGEYGVKGNLMKAIRSLYEGSQACVRVGGRLSEWFSISQGVRQGCVLSPWLFNVFMDRVMREVKDRLQGGVQLTATTVQVLLFADDIYSCMYREEGRYGKKPSGDESGNEEMGDENALGKNKGNDDEHNR